MARHLSLDQMTGEIGRALPPSRWITVDQARIDRFADTTEDWQFIHVDPEAAAKTPFGGTIAHGFLSLSLLTALMPEEMPRPEGAAMGVNYGFDRVRFIEPVRAGARVRGHFTLCAFAPRRPGQYQARWEVSVEIEGTEKPALRADWLTLVVLKPEEPNHD